MTPAIEWLEGHANRLYPGVSAIRDMFEIIPDWMELPPEVPVPNEGDRVIWDNSAVRSTQNDLEDPVRIALAGIAARMRPSFYSITAAIHEADISFREAAEAMRDGTFTWEIADSDSEPVQSPASDPPAREATPRARGHRPNLGSHRRTDAADQAPDRAR